jgi:hypothetical protein
MSGERPSRPLWPEGLRNRLKLPPVENQRTETLAKGVAAPVAKQPELSKPGEQTGENPELKWQASLTGEPAPFQPNPKERRASERLGKPPPQEVHEGPLSGPGSQGKGRETPEPQQARELDFPSFEQELFLTERFGVPLENYRAIARGLYGKEVDIENLTEEQKAKIEALHRGFNQGWKKGVERFFKDRKANE